jgi:hypothetical protein
MFRRTKDRRASIDDNRKRDARYSRVFLCPSHPKENAMTMKSLVGMSTVMNVGHGTYRTGSIEAQVTETHYLVRYDDMKEGAHTMGMEIVSVDEFAIRLACDECGERAWEFFNTRKEMLDYLDWMNSLEGEKPGVVTEFPGSGKHKPN